MASSSPRRQTRSVFVGPVGVGSRFSIRVQSMTTSDTRDVEATVDQIMRLADAGCEIARVTVQGKKEAESCGAIRNRLIQRNYSIPLVADIHFYPPAALAVLPFVDKVRINPGNFADKRATFRVIEYTDALYAQELIRLEEAFLPLLFRLKAERKALRIGVNHGSLSDRILNRYGDTPRGMVESAFEYARLCRAHGFHDVIFSMKASNPLVMIEANRLLVDEMDRLGWDYPIHLGVTEAGAGEDGRIKSALGIGALLLDGIGDTVRVSLTEDPWEEIGPCQELIAAAEKWRGTSRWHANPPPRPGAFHRPDPFPADALFFSPQARVADEVRALPQGRPIILSLPPAPLIETALIASLPLADRLVQGIDGPHELSLALLQASRLKITKTDFISCPGCGRTLFDLQTVSAEIRARTAHLPGVKIAIMGCIVNGPGEMADADFGYVGSKPDKIDLYVGKTCVERDIPHADAVERLVALLKAHGRWVEPSAQSIRQTQQLSASFAHRLHNNSGEASPPTPLQNRGDSANGASATTLLY